MHLSGIGSTWVGKICHPQICSLIKAFCLATKHLQHGQQQYRLLWTLPFFQATLTWVNELSDAADSLPPSAFRSFLSHSHCLSPQVSSNHLFQVFPLSCSSWRWHSSIISISRVCNLTQNAIFGLSFTYVEYLIWFSSKGSVSSEYNTETNFVKAAVSGSRV